MAGKIELTLIDRQGCHLCEEANADLARIVGEMNIRFPNLEYSIQTLDVDSDAALLAKYSDEVPVLLLNGKQIAFHRINADRVLNAIQEML
jgi:glutaredoxin